LAVCQRHGVDLAGPPLIGWVTQSAVGAVSAPAAAGAGRPPTASERHRSFPGIRRVFLPHAPQRVPTQTALRPQPRAARTAGAKAPKAPENRERPAFVIQAPRGPQPTTMTSASRSAACSRPGRYPRAVHQPEGQADGAPHRGPPAGICDIRGRVPEGEYGAGGVIVWDHGTYANLTQHEMTDCLTRPPFVLPGR